MSKPPIKAMESIKNYCEKTQCRRCVYGVEEADFYVSCALQNKPPCDWEVPEKGERE